MQVSGLHSPEFSAKLPATLAPYDSFRVGADLMGTKDKRGGMEPLDELEQRITTALERIASAGGGLSAGGGDTAEMEAALEAERTANAQLEERVRAIKEKQETMVAALEAEVAELKTIVEKRDAEVQRIRRVNATLRTHTQELREANSAGLADAHLVNKAMASELEALRSAQETTQIELDDIIGALEPMLEEG